MKTLLVLLLAASPLAAVAEGAAFKLDAAHSTLTYKVVHKFHESVGVSKQVQGAAAFKGSDALVQVRATVDSFDSGNANRDAHMKETVEAARFPEVGLKGVLKGFPVPTTFPAHVKAQLEGQLSFHGETHAITIPVELDFESAARVHATTAFDFSLDAYKVDRPSLMFVKIDDACHISGDLQFVR
jgi:polyisoprenoid-binding protein YceI